MSTTGMPKDAIEQKWAYQQEDMIKDLITHDDFSWTLDTLKRVAGMDISFIKNSNYACASLIVMEYPSMKVLYEDYEIVYLDKPYIPGFLAFREVPGLILLIDKLEKERPELMPEVILMDGNGIHHPRKCGVACHLGILKNIPSVGVAKNLLCIDGLTRETVKPLCKANLKKRGDTVEMRGDSGQVYGVALRGGLTASNWVYVSPGHRIGLDTATKLVLSCCNTKIPEPIRQADLRSREVVRNWEKTMKEK
jgi:deoxyinosine 3'endonuclease (endonuclease V)